jgi:nucleosome binding factor SPN SPT16 subunit
MGTESSSEFLDPTTVDIRSLNLQWLMIVRESARKDIDEAVIHFGVNPETAKLIASSATDVLLEMADPTITQFRPRGNRFLGALQGKHAERTQFILSAISTADLDDAVDEENGEDEAQAVEDEPATDDSVDDTVDEEDRDIDPDTFDENDSGADDELEH